MKSVEKSITTAQFQNIHSSEGFPELGSLDSKKGSKIEVQTKKYLKDQQNSTTSFWIYSKILMSFFLPLISFVVIIILLLSISSSFVYDDMILKNFERGQIFTISCISTTEIQKNKTGTDDDYKFIQETRNFTLIILNQSISTQMIFIHDNFSSMLMDESFDIDADILNEILFVIVEAQTETGQILNVKHPNHVSEEYMQEMLPYLRGFLVNKRHLANETTEEQNLRLEAPHMKVKTILLDNENSFIIRKNIRNEGKMHASLSSENQTINTLIDGISTNTIVSQHINKKTNYVDMFLAISKASINLFSSLTHSEVPFESKSTVSGTIKEASKKVKEKIIEKAIDLFGTLTLNHYEEPKIQDFDKRERELKNIRAHRRPVSEIFGKKMIWEMTMNDMDDETSNFTTKLILENFFEWELCHGLYGPERAKRVKQVYFLKNTLDEVSDDVYNQIFILSDSKIDETLKLLDKIKNDINENYNEISKEFDLMIDNINQKQTEYSNILRSDPKKDYTPIFMDSLTNFKKILDPKIESLSSAINTEISDFNKLTQLSYSNISDKASTIENIKNNYKSSYSISLKNPEHLFDFKYFSTKKNDTIIQSKNLKQKIDSIFDRIDKIISSLNETKNQILSEFNNKFAEEIEETKDIQRVYGTKINDGKKIVSNSKKSFSEILESSFNLHLPLIHIENISIYYNDFIINSTLVYLDNTTTFLEDVKNYFLENSDVYNLSCEKTKQIQVNVKVQTDYAIINTPINIIADTNYYFEPGNTSERIFKKVYTSTTVKISGTNTLKSSSFIVKDFFNAVFVLALAYQIGFNMFDLHFFDEGTTIFDITKYAYVYQQRWESYEYKTCRHPCGIRTCDYHIGYRWSTPKYLLQQNIKNEKSTSSFNYEILDFLKIQEVYI